MTYVMGIGLYTSSYGCRCLEYMLSTLSLTVRSWARQTGRMHVRSLEYICMTCVFALGNTTSVVRCLDVCMWGLCSLSMTCVFARVTPRLLPRVTPRLLPRKAIPRDLQSKSTWRHLTFIHIAQQLHDIIYLFLGNMIHRIVSSADHQ